MGTRSSRSRTSSEPTREQCAPAASITAYVGECTLLWAARLASTVDGAFVECGTGRGFMASATCDYLGWTDRPFYLYDTFEPAWPDGAGDQTGATSPCYASSVVDVRENFAEWPGVRLVVGRIPEILAEDSPEGVAFLHADLNHAARESAAVRHFWPRIPPGAVLIFDDYGFEGFEASREAADAMGRELGFSVLASPTGQAVVIKSVP